MYTDAPYTFIVDTNSYAGNFERELCGYITGYWDNETHGGVEAEQFHEELEIDESKNPFKDIIEYLPTCDDDCPIITCQCLERSPEDFANSVGIFFNKKPSQEQIDLLKHRALKYAKETKIYGTEEKIKILGFRLRQVEIKITQTVV